MAAKPQPEQSQLPVVQRLRVRYAKRGPLRFTSHRDFARAFERAVRRAGLPIAYSQGFTPHPKISYASAAPTGAASEAEYLEVGLHTAVDPAWARTALDAALSPGLDILDVRPAPRPERSRTAPRPERSGTAPRPERSGTAPRPERSGTAPGGGVGLADLLTASRWLVELPGVEPVRLAQAVAAFLAQDVVLVERMTKQGRRRFDARAAVAAIQVAPDGFERSGRQAGDLPGAIPDTATTEQCAMMDIVVRQAAPAVRPDDVLAGLLVVADLAPPVPPRVTRLAQGMLTPHGEIADPLEDGEVLSHSVVGDPVASSGL